VVSNDSTSEKPAASVPANAAMPDNGGLPMRVAARRFGWWLAALAALFCIPLLQLLRLALKDDLYSHVPLMPLVMLYLVWVVRHRLPRSASSSGVGAAVFAGVGVLALLAYGLVLVRGTSLLPNDRLALTIGAFVCLLLSAAFLCFGSHVIRAVAGPVSLLVFFIPFPTFVKNGLEIFLQYSSAEAAYWLFQLTDVPIHREGVTFVLPGITIKVAEECSGIRSSLVLFITGLIGGCMFLEKPVHRFWFSLVTIPLGIIRNGFRVLIIALLCVHVDPGMIHSYIHRRGGPIFFVLSLIPLLGFLILLRNREQRSQARTTESGRRDVQASPVTNPSSGTQPRMDTNKHE
jgi:exosortase C (VPDSG-CTERM-specific)